MNLIRNIPQSIVDGYYSVFFLGKTCILEKKTLKNYPIVHKKYRKSVNITNKKKKGKSNKK